MSDPLTLGETTPEFRPVTVFRDGQPVKLNAYVAGKRCPGTIKAQVKAARDEYDATTQRGQFEPVFDDVTGEPMMRPKVSDDGQPTYNEHGHPLLEPVMRDLYHPIDEAWYRMLRLILGAVVLDLSIDEADVLSGNDVETIAILRELEWWPKLPAEESEGNAKGRARRKTSRSSSPA